MKSLQFTIIVAIPIVFLYYLNRYAPRLIPGLEAGIFTEIIVYLVALLILMWLLGITYNGLWSAETFRKYPLFRWGLGLFLLVYFYAWFIGRTIYPVYTFTKGSGLSKVYTNDATLGHRTKPNSAGESYVRGEPYPIVHDEQGCRIPANYQHTYRRPLILYLGCSFTYGDCCVADSTFAHFVAQDLGGDYLNAGANSYGLSQMLVRAQELIPRYKPDYVVVEHAFWLAQRSMRYYQDYLGGEFPIPYISTEGLRPPVFKPRGLDIPLQPFEDSPQGIFDFLKFYATLAPSFVYQHYHAFVTTIKSWLGQVPPPETDEAKANNYGYETLYRLSKAHGATMLVWTIGGNTQSMPVPTVVEKLGIPVVPSNEALLRKYPIRTNDDYYRYYAHWQVSPQGDSTLVDHHPNPHAHRIIADEMVRVIRELPRPSVALASQADTLAIR